MKDYLLIARIKAPDDDSAMQVAEERLGHDEDYGFPYVIDQIKVEEDSVLDEIKSALEGDSNDAEHDALVSAAGTFGIEYRNPDDVTEDD